jgi:hypothetical protein
MRIRTGVVVVAALAAVTAVAAPASAAAPVKVSTPNWAGYAVAASTAGTTLGTFGTVTGTFTVPQIECTGDQDTAEVGWFTVTGGQSWASEAGAGVIAICQYDTVHGGQKQTFLLASELNAGGVAGPAVKPGQVITSTVTVTGSKYVMTAKDVTSGAHKTWTKTCSASCDHTIAGWMTVNGGGPAHTPNSGPLAGFADPRWRSLSAKITGATQAFPVLHFAPIYSLSLLGPDDTVYAHPGDLGPKGFPTIYSGPIG